MDIPTTPVGNFSTLQTQMMVKRAEVDAATLSKVGKSGEAIRKTAENFEGMFLSSMLKPMFESIKADPMTGGGSAENMWRSMQLQEYGKIIAKAGGIGIADSVERQLLKLQEVAQ